MNELRLPPQNLDAERSVLGSLMLLNEAFDRIDLRADEFYRNEHQKIFETFKSMYTQRRPVDAVTLAEELESRGILGDVGGPAYIAEIVDSVPHAAHILTYSKIVREKAAARSLIYACNNAIAEAYQGQSDDLVEQLQSKLNAIRESGCSDEVVTIADAIDECRRLEKDPQRVHSTGLIDLDRQLDGGIRGGQMVIVGGRPGDGKSVLTAQIVEQVAKEGKRALIVSLEMTRAEIAGRYLKHIDESALRQRPISIIDSVYDAERIAGLIRICKRRQDIQIAVLDYLQLAETSDRRLTRERQIADISRTCKRLAIELRIPIVAACQLNRTSEREKRPPRLSDLRESGAIEQDADIVMLISRGETNDSKIIVAKHRNGRPGIVPVTFRPEKIRFENSALFTGGF